MSNEIVFGSLNKRHLCVRYWLPWGWRALVSRYEYRAWWCWHKNSNHRCYCFTGTLFDLSVRFAGFGFVAFYSRYDGDIPCTCDLALAEICRDE